MPGTKGGRAARASGKPALRDLVPPRFSESAVPPDRSLLIDVGRLLRFPELHALVSLSRSTVWRMERAGSFPQRRQISARAVGWRESEIIAWIASRAVIGTSPQEGQ